MVMQIRMLTVKGLFCSSGKEILVFANLETVINISNFLLSSQLCHCKVFKFGLSGSTDWHLPLTGQHLFLQLYM